MSRMRFVVLICALCVIGGYIALLSVDTESSIGRIIYGNAFIPAFLFFAFFGAFAGVLKILIDLLLPTAASSQSMNRWKRIRARGKKRFLVIAGLTSGIPLVAVLGYQLVSGEGSWEHYGTFTILLVVLIGGIVGITNALWAYEESRYIKGQKEAGET